MAGAFQGDRSQHLKQVGLASTLFHQTIEPLPNEPVHRHDDKHPEHDDTDVPDLLEQIRQPCLAPLLTFKSLAERSVSGHVSPHDLAN